MKLDLATAVARQQISPDYLGKKWPSGGIYRASNGQFMTSTNIATRPERYHWTWNEFLQAFNGKPLDLVAPETGHRGQAVLLYFTKGDYGTYRVWKPEWLPGVFEVLTEHQFVQLRATCKLFTFRLQEHDED